MVYPFADVNSGELYQSRYSGIVSNTSRLSIVPGKLVNIGHSADNVVSYDWHLPALAYS
jgi:hypothetical protein